MVFNVRVKGLAGAFALSLLAGGAAASTVDLTYTGPSASDPRNVRIAAAPTAAGATTPMNAGAFGFNMTASDPDNNTVLDRFLAWCLDIGSYLGTKNSAFAYKITNSPFSNSEGLDAAQLTSVQNVFNANYGALDATDGVQAAGFQVALWNALYDTDTDAGGGDFKISSTYGSGSAIISQANTYLTNASGYDGLKEFNLTFYESTSDPKKQNLVSATPVPLPAAGFLFLGALGGLAALRRRKRTT